jgi:branched-chain amino acid aminotransferase
MMYYHPNTTVFLNGQWIKAGAAQASLYTQTLHYGFGVFEGIRAYKTASGARLFKAKEHYERLLYSCDKVHFKLNYTPQQLIDLTSELLDRNGYADAYIRPLVFAGAEMSLKASNEVNLLLCSWEWPPYFGKDGLRVMTSSYQRPNPRSCHVEAKVTGHYVNSILATTEAKHRGYDEALMLDMNGNIAEAPGANFFYEREGALYTCPRGNILPGITRATVISLAREMKIPVHEKFFPVAEAEGADGAFFTGTAAEVIGIASLNDAPFRRPWPETTGHRLARAYKELVLSNERPL